MTESILAKNDLTWVHNKKVFNCYFSNTLPTGAAIWLRRMSSRGLKARDRKAQSDFFASVG